MYESHAEISEAREELEMLRLKYEAALQEVEDARRQTAAAQSGLAAALASQASLTPREDLPAQPSSADVRITSSYYCCHSSARLQKLSVL